MVGIYIILAAGRGAPDGPPLALLEVEGETLLSHHVHAAQLARLGGPICVTGADAERVEADHAQYPMRFLRNDDPDSSMMRSVRLALAAVPRENAAYVTPVDVVPPRLDTLDLLAEAIEAAPAETQVLRPVMRGRAGYPLVLLPEAVAALLADGSVDRIEDWLAAAEGGGRLRTVEVDDYNVVSNLHRGGGGSTAR